jgi:hypothetical protein
MSTQEQEKIIKELREKTVKVEFGESAKTPTKIDKKTVWVKAQKAAKTISDDDLPAGHPAAA